MRDSSHFATTRWTCVLQAQGESAEARAALNELCAAYYGPVQSFLRHSARAGESADDLTHEFFTRILTGHAFGNADPRKGRFRSYLLGAVKHFLADVRDRQRALKRGQRFEHLSIDPGTDTSPGLDVPDPNVISPDVFFTRQWALTVLDRALLQLQQEMIAADKGDHFESMKPWLSGAAVESQAAVASQLGITENALKVAIHRLRRRFREIVTQEISQTVVDPAQQQAELQDLINALSH